LTPLPDAAEGRKRERAMAEDYRGEGPSSEDKSGDGAPGEPMRVLPRLFSKMPVPPANTSAGVEAGGVGESEGVVICFGIP